MRAREGVEVEYGGSVRDARDVNAAEHALDVRRDRASPRRLNDGVARKGQAKSATICLTPIAEYSGVARLRRVIRVGAVIPQADPAP
jgi:hypothetical protein